MLQRYGRRLQFVHVILVRWLLSNFSHGIMHSVGGRAL